MDPLSTVGSHINLDFQHNKITDIISTEFITSRIYFIRGQKDMIDRDLAELYGVPTKRLKEQVRRNILRFPEDLCLY